MVSVKKNYHFKKRCPPKISGYGPALMCARTCAYQGVRNVRFFRKIWRAMFSCYLHFDIRLFALLPTKYV